MNRTRPAAGGGKVVEVAAARLAGWLDRFAQRHDGVRQVDVDDASFTVQAADGATATAEVPFPPLTEDTLGRPLAEFSSALLSSAPPQRPLLLVDAVRAHLAAPRRVGLVLVRLGGHSVGVVAAGRVLVSATDHRPVHGRNKAGGWSQQRFARRRAGQARVALLAAAQDIQRVLGTRLAELDAVVLGGDRHALDELRARPALAGVFALAQPRVLDVPSPRRLVLDEAAERAFSLEILVREPAPEGS
ncbi:MAG TPA: acVLRF1 family peptidyl-tRNA hydrolase [Pseudonocardiaceae bacterium]|nr:acVLRF1 family peptidyl-tRNA hydrolase [Pseudonocardiaceae bacterium]